MTPSNNEYTEQSTHAILGSMRNELDQAISLVILIQK